MSATAQISAIIYGPKDKNDWQVPIRTTHDDLGRACIELPRYLSEVVGLKMVLIHDSQWDVPFGAALDAYGIDHECVTRVKKVEKT